MSIGTGLPGDGTLCAWAGGQKELKVIGQDGVCWVAGREQKEEWKAFLVAQFKLIVHTMEYH